MARRKQEGAQISLVPILSVQKCAMGVMVVIICAQNMVALGRSMSHKDDQVLEIAGSSQEAEAVYVECQATKVLIHSPEPKEVSLAELQGGHSSAFHKLLDELQASKGKKYLVLLVRPEGIATYDPCFKLANIRMANDENFRVGKEAVLSGGDIILTRDGISIHSTKKAGL
jgi:hypothetical protein